ncbi:hypothetical protein [uncultured Microbacterium sp.]|uniref:hypothetical protein n=1 Tax=uncultured Microbacterium sp. TaxID=191216 RepID=UPI0025D3CF1E|nr:hypothetical protein [uncultured Microbacterium sp.]
MIDIPDGFATVLVALIGAAGIVVGAWLGRRASRIAVLERENRQMWLALRSVVDLLYREGLEIPAYLNQIFNPEED